LSHCSELEKAIQAITELDSKYRSLLSIVQEYALKSNQIEACPACGTRGITSDHLLRHVLLEQQKLNPRLPELEKNLAYAKSDAEQKQRKVQELEQNLRTIELSFRKYLQDIYNASDQRNREATERQAEALRFKQQKEETERLLIDFRNKAISFKINPQDNHLHEQIAVIKQQLDEEWNQIIPKISDRDIADLQRAIDAFVSKIKRFQENFHEINSQLEHIGMHFDKNLAWAEEELPRHLSRLINKYKSEEAEITKEEQSLKQIEHAVNQLDHLQELNVFGDKLKSIEQRKEQLSVEIENINKKIKIMEELYRNVPVAVEKLNEKVVHVLFDTIKHIFQRLNCHPLYRTLDFKTVHRRRANRLLLTVISEKLTESDTDISANPSFIFSAAQENAIVLSFFLAMALRQQWSTLSLVAMDDPLQSMDDLNVLSFVDLIRMFADQTSGLGKQIIISTHDLTFFELMMKKFRHLNVGVVEFESFGKNGPLLSQGADGQLVHFIKSSEKVRLSHDFLIQTL